MPPLLDYQTKLRALETALASAHSIRLITLVLLASTALILLLLTWLVLERRIPAWNAVLPLPIAVALVRRYVRNRSELSRFNRLQNYYRRGIERIEYRFAGHGFSGEEFFLADHIVKGNRLLPGVAYLEMARAAMAASSDRDTTPRDGMVLQNVVWLRPVIVADMQEVHIDLTCGDLTRGDDVGVEFEIYSAAREDRAPETRVVHAQGRAKPIDSGSSESGPAHATDLSALLGHCDRSIEIHP